MSNRNWGVKYRAIAAKPATGGVSRRTLVIGMTAAAGGGALPGACLARRNRRMQKLSRYGHRRTAAAAPDGFPICAAEGYRVIVNNVGDPVPIKISLGIPRALHSCHTAKIGNYIVEGPVPVAAVAKLLEQRPELKGIALPGMPEGSPGMPGISGVYRVFGFSADGSTRPFADVRV